MKITKNSLFLALKCQVFHVSFLGLKIVGLKSEVLNQQFSITKIEFFAKGKRGIIYTGKYKNRKVAVKLKNPKSLAVSRIQNEAKYLKLLNKYDIGPRFLFFKDKRLVYEFVEGDFIIDFIEKNSKSKVIKILQKIFNQLFILDKLKINKEEMHRPIKHIVVNKNNKPILIDFERAHRTQKPHNVTQFCQFLISKNLAKILNKKNIKISRKKIINLAKKYKKEINERNLNRIKNEICL